MDITKDKVRGSCFAPQKAETLSNLISVFFCAAEVVWKSKRAKNRYMNPVFMVWLLNVELLYNRFPILTDNFH
ncbi:hypothetical protein SDC9_123701 [bioreactor metagenome]|uniref:Uncharacterized protein n=1 Tax=bioreactor metagenome TaxID=1076179 RepID=A0A645CIV2_9ZZZZ